MKAVRRADGSIEVDGSAEEIQRVFGIVAQASPVVPSKTPEPVGVAKPSAKFTGPRPAGERVDGSIPARLEKVFASQPERVFRLSELAVTLGEKPRAVASAASRMARGVGGAKPAIVSVGRGKYRAAPKETATG